MKKLGLNEIRTKYLEYFGSHEHLVLPSYPLVPQDDDTLMFIVAGMVPLKDYFSGLQTPPKTRIATSQKCIRTNDIDNVGRTARHASFFEMLGNFSFGDYFKKEAIHLAWDFVTNVLEIPKEKLWVTVYLDDDEAFEIWRDQEGVPENRILRMGKTDNFWEMGTGTGPCGPCSEIYFDRGEKYNTYEGECQPGGEGDRFLEFWNLVFTQFDKKEDGTLVPLEKKNIDTGMGLERIACLMQDVNSIFDVDVFQTIIKRISEIAGLEYGKNEDNDISMRVITDHMRSVTFLITDGVVPDNEGRGYVLRRLLRRSARHGRLLGVKKNFLSEIAGAIIAEFGTAYPNLIERADYTKKIIDIEEKKFSETIDQGLSILESYVDELKKEGKNILSGEAAFKLYDTYGFPLDLSVDILKSQNIEVDEAGFKSEMQAQRERARAARSKAEILTQATSMKLNEYSSEFIGYKTIKTQAEVIAILADGEFVDRVDANQKAQILLNKTPFYAESGGQIGDIGTIEADCAMLVVDDTKKLPNGIHAHHAHVVSGELKVGDIVSANVDEKARLATKRNHSVAHLLHKALKMVLGDSVSQAGSYVSPDKMRFDFSYFQALTDEEIAKIEEIVNREIYNELPVIVEEMSMDEAMKTGAEHLFNEKYGDVVRVVTMGDADPFSIEFCGGTHCSNTSEIGIFRILSENGISAGVRRIEAITGQGVYNYLQNLENEYGAVLGRLKTRKDSVMSRIDNILDDNAHMKKELQSLRGIQQKILIEELRTKAYDKDGVKVIKHQFDNFEMDILKDLAFNLANVSEPMLVVFSDIQDGKVNFFVKANDLAVKKGVHSGNIAKSLAQICGGGGGGKPDSAQAGAKDISKVDEAMKTV